MVTEESQAEGAVLQRRIFLWFCTTFLAGMTLCTIYLTGRIMHARPRVADWPTPPSHQELVVVPVPNPPAPAVDSASAPSPLRSSLDGRVEKPTLKLDIIAIQDAWLEVETDGHATFTKLVRAEQAISFGASERIRMKTGNAPGLNLRFNGQAVAASLSNRRVRTLEFTKAGARELSSSARPSETPGLESRSLQAPQRVDQRQL